MSGPTQTPAVLVVSYRRADLLARCLDSVAEHLPGSPVLVWDNASDGTPGVRELAASAPGVDWTFHPTNAGFGAAVNGLAARAAELAPGADLLLLNPDAELTGDLAATRAALVADVAVASPRVTEDGVPSWDVAHRRQGVLRSVVSHLGYAPRLRGRAVSDLYAHAPTEVDGYLTGCCLLVSRRAWDALGGFDERFFVYAEEAELQQRALTAGWRLLLVDEHHVRHAGHGTVADDPVAARRSRDLLRNHHALLLGVHGNRGPGTAYLAATALLERAQRSTRRAASAARAADPGGPPQVVLTTNELVRGGAERQRVQLAGELAARGHPVTLVCLQGLGPLLAEVDPRVRVVLSPWWQPWPQGLDTATRPTVLITDVTNTEVGFALALTRARRGAHRPRWLTASHQPPVPDGPTYAPRLAAAAARADGLVALSPAHLAELTRFQELAQPAHLAANGVPDREHPPRPAPGTPLRLGMLSRIVEHKNPHLLVRALAPLADLPWTLDIFGDGPDRARLEALTPPELAGRVRWRGWSPGPDDAFPQLDVLCVPSETEAFPLVIVEAMAAGVPVVAAGVCAVPDMLDHGRAGTLVPPGSVAAWTDVLRRVLGDPGSLGPLTDAARERQQQRYTVRAMADAYERAISDTLRA